MNSSSDPLAGADQRGRELVLGGLFIALGVVVPLLFHALPGGGRMLLPMHWPVLLAGCLLSPLVALQVGLLTPWVSLLATGMPPFPLTLVMSAELAMLGGSAALLARRGWSPWAVVVPAALARGVVTWVIYTIGGVYLGVRGPLAAGAVLLAGLPGVVAQIVLVPAVAAQVRGRLTPTAGLPPRREAQTPPGPPAG